VTSLPIARRASAARSAAGSCAASEGGRPTLTDCARHAVDPDAFGDVIGGHGEREREDGPLMPVEAR
jgi:hypothetical protein